MLVELSRSNFKQIVDQQKVVLIECWAPGCGVCTQFDPVFAEVAAQHEQHVFARMNVLTEDRLGEFFEIEHTPCLMLYRDGLLLFKKPGNFSADALNEIIAQAASLDMEMVRADLESSETPDREGRDGNG